MSISADLLKKGLTFLKNQAFFNQSINPKVRPAM